MSRLRQSHLSTIGVGHLEDDSLRRAAKRGRRQLEDIEAGDSGKSKRQVTVYLRDVEGEIELREALRETWLADEYGTDSYTDFKARGGLSATMACKGLRPSYSLAIRLDRLSFDYGRAHVLEWDESERACRESGLYSYYGREGHEWLSLAQIMERLEQDGLTGAARDRWLQGHDHTTKMLGRTCPVTAECPRCEYDHVEDIHWPEAA